MKHSFHCVVVGVFLALGCEPAPVHTAPTVVSAAPSVIAPVPTAEPSAAPTTRPERPFVEPEPPKPAPTISAQQRIDCDHECGRESSRCSNGCAEGEAGRGCLRICGCARMVCEQSCETKGKPDFRCH